MARVIWNKTLRIFLSTGVGVYHFESIKFCCTHPVLREQYFCSYIKIASCTLFKKYVSCKKCRPIQNYGNYKHHQLVKVLVNLFARPCFSFQHSIQLSFFFSCSSQFALHHKFGKRVFLFAVNVGKLFPSVARSPGQCSGLKMAYTSSITSVSKCFL
jgi:hypothetical protein